MKEIGDPSGRTFSGKYAILAILLLGVAAAVGSQLYYKNLQERPMALWGKEPALLFAKAPLASAMLLVPAEGKRSIAPLERIMVGGEHFGVLDEHQVAGRPGLSHIRQALLNDNSFDWSEAKKDCKPEWKYALEFSNGNAAAMLLIAPNCGLVRLTTTGATGNMQPVMPGLDRFMHDLFPEKK